MRIAIIDDIYEDGQSIANQLNLFFMEHYTNTLFSFSIYQNEDVFLKQFEKNSFDFIFMDYFLENTTGFDLAKRIRQKDTGAILIFITASRDYAIDCYKVKASGYLTKPLNNHELTEIMAFIDFQEMKDRQFIEILNGYEKVKILLRDIIYCDIAGHYAQIHTQSSGVQKSRITFTEMVHMLSAYPEFFVCYKGCLINMNYINKIINYTFLMTNGERIPFRKKENTKVLRLYADFLFEKVRGGEYDI